jgi:hypothetical protein
MGPCDVKRGIREQFPAARVLNAEVSQKTSTIPWGSAGDASTNAVCARNAGRTAL